MTIRTIREGWPLSHRIVSSRFPPIGVFDDVARAEDLEAVFWVEGLTNPRLRQEMGDISVVPENDRITGDGTTPIMAAFTHLNPNGSRYTDGSYGVYYAAREEETAIAETVYHVGRWSAQSHDPPSSFIMRLYIGELKELDYHDIRGEQHSHPELYSENPNQYHACQTLGNTLRSQGSWGLFYDSVRTNNGQCIAVFRPKALDPIRQSKHYAYVWDGSAIIDVQELVSRGVPSR